MKRSSIEDSPRVRGFKYEYTSNDAEVLDAVTRALGHLKRVPAQYPYRGFTLRCRPQPTPSGRFLAYVVILRGQDLKTVQALRGFTLRCRPQPTPSGRFLAYVVILRGQDLRTVKALSPNLPSFVDQVDAIRAGLDIAQRWVDHNGLTAD